MNQHTSPCSGCPFRRDIKPGELGGSPAETYVGQIVLPFWLPCHMSPNYQGKESKATEVCQCAGAAIFRANIGIVPPRPLLALPRDTDKVFSTLADFYAHHKSMMRTDALLTLRPSIVRQLAERELNNAGVKVQLIPR